MCQGTEREEQRQRREGKRGEGKEKDFVQGILYPGSNPSPVTQYLCDLDGILRGYISPLCTSAFCTIK